MHIITLQTTTHHPPQQQHHQQNVHLPVSDAFFATCPWHDESTAHLSSAKAAGPSEKRPKQGEISNYGII